MPPEKDDKIEATSLVEDEVESLSRLSAALTALKHKLEGRAGALQKDCSHLTGALQAVEREADLLNDAMSDGSDSLRHNRDEALTGLNQLERDLTTTADGRIAEDLRVLHEAQAGFQEAIHQEEAKIDAVFDAITTAFSGMSEATSQWKSTLETDQAEYEEGLRQLDQRATESGEEIVHLSENAYQMIVTTGGELIERHLAEVQRGLRDLDQQTHEKLWGQLQTGFEQMRSQSSHHLDAFGKEVLDVGNHLGEIAKNIFGDLTRHTESGVREALESSFIDATKYGVEVLIEEVAIQLAEAAAGQTISATLPELAAAIKAAQAQLEIRKTQRGIKKVIVDGANEVGDFIGNLF